MDRWVTPPKRVTSPTWGSPPPGKQARSLDAAKFEIAKFLNSHRDDLPENVVKITAQECKKTTSSQRTSLENVVA